MTTNDRHPSTMAVSIGRRALLLGATATAMGACHWANDSPLIRLAAIEARLGGRIGVAAWDAGSERRIAHRGDERFAMCSTFKALLVCMALRRVDEGALMLATRVPFTASDLLEYAPDTRAHLGDGAMTVEALCAAAVERSDNTAANLLLAQLGGPAGLTAFLRATGDATTRLDRNEPTLNTNLAGDPRDTTTASAMARTMATLLLSPRVLSPASRARIEGWMVASSTGRARLRAGMPSTWRIGDKTGTGERGACNDVAVAWPPGRAPIVVAAYVEAPVAGPRAREEAHVEIGRVVAGAFG